MSDGVLRFAYGSISLFIAILNNVFLLYYVEVFVSVYKIDRTSFWLGEAVFLIWNSVNDPLFGWLSDHKALGKDHGPGLGSSQIVEKRFRALMRCGPLFALSFMAFWFPWSSPSLQFMFCLCFYDGFLTVVDLNHMALLADVTLSGAERTVLNTYCSVFSGLGSFSVFASYYVWDRNSMESFQVFCFALAMFALVGFTASSLFLKRHFSMSKNKVDTPMEDTHMTRSLVKFTVSSSDQKVEFVRYVKQLAGHKNFLWFTLMNLTQVFHCHFNSNFFPLFLDKLLGDFISPQTAAFLLGVSFVMPHINNLYFLSLCRRYGVYQVIKLLFYVKLLLSGVMLFCGLDWPVLLCMFIASNRVFTEGTCKLLNLIISDLVDEDFVLHNRNQAISALVFGTTALFSKPGQTLAPLVGTWLLAKETGYSLFYSDSPATEKSANFHSGAPDSALRWGCFYVLVYVPIICACIQIFAWSRFSLHGRRLDWVKNVRQGRETSAVRQV